MSWARIPERRIYLRARDRRLHCLIVGPRLQIAIAAVSLLLLAWIAFTSVNLLVANRTIAIERQRFEHSEARYAAQRQLIDALQARQRMLAAIIERKEKIDSALRLPFADADAAASHSLGPAPQNPAPSKMPEGEAAAPRQEGFLAGARGYIAKLFGFKGVSFGIADRPAPIAFESGQKLLAALGGEQLILLRELTGDLDKENITLDHALERTGIAPETPMPFYAQAGLMRPIRSVTQTEDQIYFAQLATASDSLDALAYGVWKTNAVPWSLPTDADYRISSPFGLRRDPFTKRRAFHAGLDLSGPGGTLVRATAPGIVTFAARKGGYGNVVEIDHGSGIRTRYGHLRSISVHTGAAVAEGTPVGRLGSTGRSTGPHVHYEVWYGNAPKDPRLFIEAGQLLLQR